LQTETEIFVQKSRSLKRGVAFFPAVKYMAGNPYWPILAAEIKKTDTQFYDDTPGAFTFKWLLDHRKQINILHIHYCQQFFTLRKGKTHFLLVIRFALTLLFARFLGYRTIFTLHNLEPTYQLQPAWVDYLGHWVAANLTDRIIVHCDTARQLASERYGRRHHVYVVDHPNCIGWYPDTMIREVARESLNLSNGLRVFTFFGGVRPNKGIETLIDAFLSLKDEDSRLVIAGKIFPPESYSQSLLDLAKGDDRIYFHLRHIPDDEIQVFMKAADVVVLPFSRILTSSSANLAMSFGCPIIVPRMGCLPDLVESGGGWLFDPYDPDSLAVAMRAAVASDLKQVGRCAFEKVLPFSSRRFAEQTIQVYWD
jgi:beta-1,4-mannosyltransferase